ncbi:hypothetical protein [Streptomyces purpurogeneiscleroticus]|uniref:hypothetical protein n=1 Tax=Streptomyces purpurogeneiscleroticus TaxID=68259 RepID=UPI001CBDF934|nr:hypothetical protein [Streptomyces purpurogeneiscleroticus]MBZ4018700.1 hypothetical protein [Streptomyces purpurogeneiscleroticus]
MHILTGVNMMSKELVLVNADEDKLVKVPLESIDGWQPASPQHTWIRSDEETVYVATDAIPPFDASIVVLRLNEVDWEAGTADVELRQIVPLDAAGTPSDMPNIRQTAPKQPIMPWTRPLYTQTHGPTFLPRSKFTYVTHYTDDRVRGFKIKDDGTLEQRVLFSDRALTRQTHGVNFNKKGTVGLGVGYDYDIGEVRVYRPDRHTGKLEVTHAITLGTETEYGAFAHYAAWIDNRYAYVGAMQAGPTSRTPLGSAVVGPSVWLIDTDLDTAERVIGPTSTPDGAGMFRPPSDLAIAKGKLYVAEEDSWRAPTDDPFVYGKDGYISVWDIYDRDRPCFLKRLRPGRELPADFRNAHTATAMYDEESVFVSSFVSDHLVRIDTSTDEVAKVYTADDGLAMFHGEFAAGRNR